MVGRVEGTGHCHMRFRSTPPASALHGQGAKPGGAGGGGGAGEEGHRQWHIHGHKRGCAVLTAVHETLDV